MSFDTLRVYEAGRLYDVELPDWYHAAERLFQKEGVNWHHSFTRVLGCNSVPLTDDGSEGGWIEVHFWPSATMGTFVLIDTEAGIIEQVLIPNPTDWLPFFTRHITPLLSAAAQMASSAQQRKLTRAYIAKARHGRGRHIERETGLSEIDLEQSRRLAARYREAAAKTEKGGVA
jgi:hypothetical protein